MFIVATTSLHLPNRLSNGASVHCKVALKLLAGQRVTSASKLQADMANDDNAKNYNNNGHFSVALRVAIGAIVVVVASLLLLTFYLGSWKKQNWRKPWRARLRAPNRV